MFTGIITAVGKVTQVAAGASHTRLTIDTAGLDLADAELGESIAVSGTCLTATRLGTREFDADVSPETLNCTTLGSLVVGSEVNLERALRLQDRLGGHLVTGHVDGIGRVLSVTPDGQGQVIRFEVPADLSRYVSRKGSICVNGVSLTVNAVDGAVFTVQVIPHTLAQTTLHDLQAGSAVNIEVDMIARYLERLLPALQPDEVAGGVSIEKLMSAGFIRG